jgi:hypothetical protein
MAEMKDRIRELIENFRMNYIQGNSPFAECASRELVLPVLRLVAESTYTYVVGNFYCVACHVWKGWDARIPEHRTINGDGLKQIPCPVSTLESLIRTLEDTEKSS